ncbi:MAG: methionyl-tRNA formyltransferase [Chloroflexota bacterium]
MGARVRAVFLGSGSFALPSLHALVVSDLVELVAVVTAPPRSAGRRGELRPTLVGQVAADRGIAVLTPGRLRDEEALAALRAQDAALMVLADYGRIIPLPVLELPRHGALNLHPSLLPRHRGASPVPAAILAADEATGVTLMRMDAGLDSGPIIAQRRLPLVGNEVAPRLRSRLSDMAAGLPLESAPGGLAGSVPAVPQPTEGVTLTRPLRRADGWLDAARSALELERQVRAYQPWPGSFVELDGERLIVWAAEATEAETSEVAPAAALESEAAIGSLVSSGELFALVTASGLLRLSEVQAPGRRRMSGAEYRRGKHR